jgi:hypothetical protein
MQERTQLLIACLVVISWGLSSQILYPFPWVQGALLEEYYDANEESVAWAERKKLGDESITRRAVREKYVEAPTKQLWIAWILQFCLILCGLVAGAQLFRRYETAKHAALLLSTIWVVFFLLQFISEVGRYSAAFNTELPKSAWNVIQLKLETLSVIPHLYSKALLIQRNFLFPLLHLAILVAIASRMRLRGWHSSSAQI